MLGKPPAATVSSSEEGERESSQENHEQSRAKLYSEGPPTASNDVGSLAGTWEQTLVVESANMVAWSLDDIQSIQTLAQEILPPAEKVLNKLIKLVDALSSGPNKLSNASDQPMSSSPVAQKDPKNFRTAISKLRLGVKDMKLRGKIACKKIMWATCMREEFEEFRGKCNTSITMIHTALSRVEHSMYVDTSVIMSEDYTH